MSQLPNSTHQLLTNLTPINIDGQTVYIAQVRSDNNYGIASVGNIANISTVACPVSSGTPVQATQMTLQNNNMSNVMTITNAGVAAPGGMLAMSLPTGTVVAPSPQIQKQEPIPSPTPSTTSSYVRGINLNGHKISNGEGTRKLLLPWLVEHLDKNSFRGVQWQNREHGLFLLPWKHGKNKGFDEETDGEIFKEWAVNTGRFRMNEQPQYKVWKATLRNALHKHPHIQEVKEYGKSGLFRVYQITVPVSGIMDPSVSKSSPNRKMENVNSGSSLNPGSVFSKASSPEFDSNVMGPPHTNGPNTPTNMTCYSSQFNTLMSPPTMVSTSTLMTGPTIQMSAPSTPLSGPRTPLTPTAMDSVSQKNPSPQDYRSTDASSIFSPLSNVSSVQSNESEYPSELEMSPGSSVVTTVDVVNNFNSSKQHIRSASGTVLTDSIDEILKQVSLPQMDGDKNVNQNNDYDMNMDLEDMLITGDSFLAKPTGGTSKHLNQAGMPGQRPMQHDRATPGSTTHDPRLSLHQQFLMQERMKQQQDQLQKQRENRGKQMPENRARKESSSKLHSNRKHDEQSLHSVMQPNLNHEQEMKLVELKKQRESLKKPLSKENSNKSLHNEPPAIDELPMHELLGADPEPRRLGKRPRLDCNTDISTEGPPTAVDYIAKLKQIGLPKKQNPNSMAITVYYKTVGVAAYGISNPVGARLYYCSNQRVQVTDEKTTNELYGPQDATQICMPWCRDNTPTQTLLGTLTRGVILQEDDGDIYATRLCQCAVFFGDKRGVLTKLERGQRVKIFDFKTRFLPLYFQHLQSQNNKSGSHGGVKVVLDPFPDPDVMLSFGQRWDDRRPIENTLIWAKVIHMKSRQLTLDFTQLFPPEVLTVNEDCIQFSESDPYDRLADAFSLAL